MNFSTFITRERESRDLNRQTAATGIGISQSMLRLWEKGVCTPGTKNIRRLSAFYGVPVDKLISLLPSDTQEGVHHE